YVKGNLSENSLPTFAFELNYMKNNQIHDGWLFGEKYSEAEYFLVMWVWADVEQIRMGNFIRYNQEQIRYENIMKMEGFFTHKTAMRNYAKNFRRYSRNLYRLKKSRRNTDSNPTTCQHHYFSIQGGMPNELSCS